MLMIRLYRALGEYCVEVSATTEPAERGQPSGHPRLLHRGYFPSEGTPRPAQIAHHVREMLELVDGYAGDLSDLWDSPTAVLNDGQLLDDATE